MKMKMKMVKKAFADGKGWNGRGSMTRKTADSPFDARSATRRN